MGIEAAIIGSAVVGAGSSIASSRAQSRAADQANRTQQQALADQNRNTERMIQLNEPFRQHSLAAMDDLAAIFGIGDVGGTATPTAPATTGPVRTGSVRAGVPFANGEPRYYSLPASAQPAPQPTTQQPLDIASLVENAPGISFLRDRGERSLERAFNARGLRNTGREFEELVGFNQDLAETSFMDMVVNPRLALAGLGQVGVQGTNSALGQQSANIGNAGTNMANIALAGGNARASAYGGLNNVAQGTFSNLMLAQMLGG